MRLSAKLGLGFGAVILIVIAMGGTSYFMLRQIGYNVGELSQHDLPAARYATGVERSALSAIHAEKDYLLSRNEESRSLVKERLKDLVANLEGIDSVASLYRDVDLASRSAEVRKASMEYRELYDQVVSALEDNKAKEQSMDAKGHVIDSEADAYMDSKKKEYLEAKDALAIVNKINAWTLEIRVNEKEYILDQKQPFIASIERNIKNLLSGYNELEKLHPNDTEKKQIANARNATEDYKKTLDAWVAEYKRDSRREALDEYIKIMNRSGDTVSQMIDDYILIKQASVEKISKSVFLVREIGDRAMNTRLSEKAYIITRDEKFWRALNEKAQELSALYTALRKLAATSADQQRIDRAAKATQEYMEAARSWVARETELRVKILPKMRENGDKVIAMARAVENDAWEKSDQVSGSTRSIVSTSNRVILFALIIGFAVGSLAAWGITRSISQPINRIIRGLNSGAEQVASASDHVSNASLELAEGTSEQAAAIEETSSSLEEIASMTKLNAEHATHVNRLMIEASSAIMQANQSMGQLTLTMGKVSASSQATQKIIKTIDEIAFQTNLLALNAAVEAARAGEAGAGFAVVANEVRSLAMRAAEAAKNTAALLEDTDKMIKEGSELVQGAGNEISLVAATASKMGGLIEEVEAASREQVQGIEQINRAVSDIDKVTQQNSANAEESASASQEMNAQARQMTEFVANLMALVEGEGNRKYPASTANDHIQGEVLTSISRKAPAHSAKSNGNGNGKGNWKRSQTEVPVSEISNKEVLPNQVIPFWDEEFKDF